MENVQWIHEQHGNVAGVVLEEGLDRLLVYSHIASRSPTSLLSVACMRCTTAPLLSVWVQQDGNILRMAKHGHVHRKCRGPGVMKGYNEDGPGLNHDNDKNPLP